MAGRVASRGSDQFMLRFPDDMRDRVKRFAEKNGRSMNAEIIARLERSLDDDEEAMNYDTKTVSLGTVTVPMKELLARMESLEKKIDQLPSLEELTKK
ncbi:Arc family DNA-binding protein [Rhizobium herbae]|uniref:DNA-binding protein n=1 Tax=Rhizobium herbae TaxID=508661 RepID=A0ABS4EPB3_9HYPH|nr:Arc family DNA-binding protein [Rhizobium herbae]MBP1859789.1 putative DNA-binding protein [Rhizobium herbae]